MSRNLKQIHKLKTNQFQLSTVTSKQREVIKAFEGNSQLSKIGICLAR